MKLFAHAFRGDGKYCRYMGPDKVIGSDDHGTVTMSIGCGYLREHHQITKEEALAIVDSFLQWVDEEDPPFPEELDLDNRFVVLRAWIEAQ